MKVLYNLIGCIFSDVLSYIAKIKKKSLKSRQSLNRKFENQKGKKSPEIPINLAISDFLVKSSFVNYVKCVHCKSNILPSASNEIEDIAEIEQINMEDRRFEKFHRCKKDCTKPTLNRNTDTGINMEKIVNNGRTLYYPLYEQLQRDRESDASSDNSQNIEMNDDDREGDTYADNTQNNQLNDSDGNEVLNLSAGSIQDDLQSDLEVPTSISMASGLGS